MKRLLLFVLLLFATPCFAWEMGGQNMRTIPVGLATAPVPPLPAWNASAKCISTDGIDDTLAGKDDGLPTSNNERTVMFWMCSLATSSGNDGIFIYGKTTQTANGWGIGQNTSNLTNPNFTISPISQERGFIATPSENWHHFSITLPQGGTFGSATFYIDGQPLADRGYAAGGGAPATPIATQLEGGASGLKIGYWPYAGYAFKGKFSEIAIFNRCLSQSEIQSYSQYLLRGSEPGLIRLYHCDEGMGSKLFDSCKSGCDLTITGATWSTK